MKLDRNGPPGAAEARGQDTSMHIQPDRGQPLLKLEQDRFGRCWRRLGARDADAWPHIERAYAEPHRRYHDAEHISECLGWFDAVRDSATDPDAVECAIWFHDVVYDPTAPDNEERSARRLESLAAAGGVPKQRAARAANLVRATAHHEAAADGDSALLVDVDLSILGASPARYDRYETSIRGEYERVPAEAYRAGRLRVLQGFLERLAIYRTDYFSTRLEARARENLARATARLREASPLGVL